LAAAVARFLITEAVPKSFGLKVVVEVDLVTVRCHWGNGFSRITFLLPSTLRFLTIEAVPQGFGLKVAVEADHVTLRCPWGNGLGRVTLPMPSTPRFPIAEAVPKGFGLVVVVGVAVVTLHGWGSNRAAGRWLVVFGRRVSLTAGPIWPAGRRELFAEVEMSFRAPIADHRRAVSALQV